MQIKPPPEQKARRSKRFEHIEEDKTEVSTSIMLIFNLVII